MRRIFLALSLILLLSGCVLSSKPDSVAISPTVADNSDSVSLPQDISGQPVLSTSPTPDPTRPPSQTPSASTYTVQAGDTLSAIAAANHVSLQLLLSTNNITNPDMISVGQTLILPAPPDKDTPSFKIVPDSRLVRGPGSRDFDIAGFINQQSGYIRTASDTIDNAVYTSAQVVEQAALEFSVDPRLLLALLEYKAHWLTNPNPDDNLKTWPMQGGPPADGIKRDGLYLQLSWAANQLNLAYYGWKENGLTTLEFQDKTRLRYGQGLNAGTVGVQYFLSLNTTYPEWAQQVTPDGFYKLYTSYFGDPFQGATDPLVPPGIAQPTLEFPFPPGQTWYFTGGPHGGWGEGSAWAAIDFAPPDNRSDNDPPCYVSQFWATAVAPGVIARSGDGVVILDLDGDGDESTGWTILYLHMASDGRVAQGTTVNMGDHIGHPSCEGGFSNGTHVHIARRYNGEWLPVTCDACAADDQIPPLVLSGWTVYGYSGQEYQGYMAKNGDQRQADQGRLSPDNRVSR